MLSSLIFNFKKILIDSTSTYLRKNLQNLDRIITYIMLILLLFTLSINFQTSKLVRNTCRIQKHMFLSCFRHRSW